MPVAIALILGVAVLAVWLIGLIWSLLLLVPFYSYLGCAVYLVLRSRRRQAELNAALDREAEKERLFNEQEFRAWRSALEKTQRNASRREKMLRHFDSTRDPPG